MNFIQKHPIKAWNRNYYGYDFNVQYIPAVKLLYNSIRSDFQYFKKTWGNKICNAIMLRFVERKVFPMLLEYDDIEEVVLQDNGEDVYPRYEIVGYLPPEETETQSGFYNLFVEDDSEIQSEWISLKKKLNEMSNLFKFYWSEPVQAFLYLKEKQNDE